MKTIFLALLLALAIPARSRPTNSQPPADYQPYFQTVKHALEQVAAEDFTGALNTYRRLFRQYRFAFPRDVFNALQLAIHTNSVNARDSLVRRGAESGVSRKAFLQNPKVRDAYLPADSLLFERLFGAGRAVWATRVDTALRQEMMSRYRDEQKSKVTPEYKSVCTDNFQRIAALAKAGRFPGEQRIGVDDDLINGFVIPTLCHYPYSYKILQKELYAAMVEGQAQPLSLIYPYGFNQSEASVLNAPGTSPDTATYAKRYNTPFGWQSSDTAAVNQARAEMFIVSLDTEKRLKQVARKYGLAVDLGW